MKVKGPTARNSQRNSFFKKKDYRGSISVKKNKELIEKLKEENKDKHKDDKELIEKLKDKHYAEKKEKEEKESENGNTTKEEDCH